MRNLRLPAALAGLVAVYGLTTGPMALATTTGYYATGSACQLSVPTIDTKFRPKATGARNESTTVSNYVICPTPLPNNNGYNHGGFIEMRLGAYSIDGASHTVSCTAVWGYYGSWDGQQGYHDLIYSTKTINVSGTDVSAFEWLGSDFGVLDGNPMGVLSVTCLLPPQTALSYYDNTYSYDTGA